MIKTITISFFSLLIVFLLLFVSCAEKTNPTSTSTPPTINSFTPTDEATSIPIDTDIIVTFNVEVTGVSGNNITLVPTGGGTTISIDVTDTNLVSILDNVVTINPTDNLLYNETYTVTIPAGAFENAANVATEEASSFSFSTMDEPPVPVLESHLPNDLATDIFIDHNIILTFNTGVTGVSGNNITLVPTGGGATISIDVTDANLVNILNNVVTINPTDNLLYNETYTVTIPAGAFENAANVATEEASSFSFSTIAVLPVPVLESHLPNDLATDIPVNSDIILTFNIGITAVSGNNITLVPTGGGATISIDVTDANLVSILNNVVTINPTDDFLYNETYTVTIPAGAFENAANVATEEASSFSFSTIVLPVPVLESHSPDDLVTDIPVNRDVILTFNIGITAVSGNNITLVPTGGGATISIDVTDANLVNILNNVVTINPTDDFLYNETYTVTIPAGAFENAVNVATEEASSFSFSTPEIPVPVLESHSPNDLATDILIDDNIILTFNVGVTAVSGKVITLVPTGGGATISIDISDITIVSPVLRDVVTINLTDDFPYNETYTVTIPAGAFENVADVATEEASSFSFSTIAVLPVVSTTPSDGDSSVAPADIDIRVNFFDEINTSRTSGNSITISGGTAPIVIPITDTDKVKIIIFPFVPRIIQILPGNLEFNTDYTVNIPLGSFSNVDNTLATQLVNFSFTTRATSTVGFLMPLFGGSEFIVSAPLLNLRFESFLSAADTSKNITITGTDSSTQMIPVRNNAIGSFPSDLLLVDLLGASFTAGVTYTFLFPEGSYLNSLGELSEEVTFTVTAN